ncbi:hypothetical protein ACWEPL_56860 [Nonomuraea sp. NPDC004186]
MSDSEAVEQLAGHRYFRPHDTPLQVFNRATDPFLPGVRDHLFAVLEGLDHRGLTNPVLVITRAHVDVRDCERLNALKNVKVTLLFTYSGGSSRTLAARLPAGDDTRETLVHPVDGGLRRRAAFACQVCAW